jgi:hypothetical protein
VEYLKEIIIVAKVEQLKRGTTIIGVDWCWGGITKKMSNNY